MFSRIRALCPGRSIAGIGFYAFVRWLAGVALLVTFGLRAKNSKNMPATGPVLVVANHQSHLDPPAIGIILPRHLTYLARASLFKNPLFGAFIRGLSSVPLKEGKGDAAAIRTAIEQLGMGRAILIFPEGSRTLDGEMTPFKRGVWLLLSRAKCPVLPVGIDGAFEAWPRGTSLPRLFRGNRVAIEVGEPIASEMLLAMKPDDGLALLAERINTLRLKARAFNASRKR